MFGRVLRAVVVLPGTVLVLVPGLLLYLTRRPGEMFPLPVAAPTELAVAGFLALSGLVGAVWTVSLFARIGRGSPAPWDPPERMVIAGPYRHVRNPMITSVVLMLGAEVLAWQSTALLAWALFFIGANAYYLPMIEEPRLVERFGDDYRRYRENVPRWLPRSRPWLSED